MLLARMIGLLVLVGSVFSLLFLIFFSLGYGGSIYALLGGIYLFVLLASGLSTLLGQRAGRLALSGLLPLQACWLMVRVYYSTPRPGQVCDMSCYAIPLETTALPVVLSFVAAWVVYPGIKTPSQDA